MSQRENVMRAVAIDRFGGLDALKVRDLPIPRITHDEVLIRLEAAGVGEWDAFEREGGFVSLGGSSQFPYVVGSEGAGTVIARLSVGPCGRRAARADQTSPRQVRAAHLLKRPIERSDAQTEVQPSQCRMESASGRAHQTMARAAGSVD